MYQLNPNRMYGKNSVKEQITESCVKMCSQDIRPFEVVGGDGFLDLQQKVNH